MLTAADLRCVSRSSGVRTAEIMLAAAVVAAAMLVHLEVSHAQGSDRSGKEVVEAVCAACHRTGENGAPRIGDAKAWSARASQGLTALTQHAIHGIRQMPAHGGNPGVTDFELERAVTYMVNQSGGQWAEPVNKAALPVARSGSEIVKAQCAKCHEAGVGGAPRIGDKAAWIPRLSQGLDAVVSSAIRGHGGMPARGGMADLTDREMRNAVVYMFNPVSIVTAPEPATPAVTHDANHKVVGGVEIYLGIVPASSTSVQQPPGSKQEPMHGGIPQGKDYYHVNVSLFDSTTKVEITDASVEVTAEDPVMGGETKKLDPMVFNNTISYGNYFHMPGTNPYKITVHVKRPSTSQMVAADFNFRHY
jgi:cytochrome c5